MPDGSSVEQYTLQNASGMCCKIITLGGIITEWSILSRENSRVDIVLGFSDLESYLAGHPHFGAITGRVAGRITGGKFSLDGIDYDLEINDPPNHLHGGSNALDKKNWQVSNCLGGKEILGGHGCLVEESTYRRRNDQQGGP